MVMGGGLPPVYHCYSLPDFRAMRSLLVLANTAFFQLYLKDMVFEALAAFCESYPDVPAIKLCQNVRVTLDSERTEFVNLWVDARR